MEALLAAVDFSPYLTWQAALGLTAVGVCMTFAAIRLSRKGVNQVK